MRIHGDHLPGGFDGGTDGQAFLAGFATGPSPGHATSTSIPLLEGPFLPRRHPQEPPTARPRRVRVRGEARDLVLRVDALLLLVLVLQEHRVGAEGLGIRIGRIHAAHRRQWRSSARRRRHKIANRTDVESGFATAWR